VLIRQKNILIKNKIDCHSALSQMSELPCTCCFKFESPSLLKRCSKCKCTLYCSETCQRRHWSAHKKSCSGVPDPEISSWTEHQCFEKIKNDLDRFVPGTKDTVSAMQRLYVLMSEELGDYYNRRFSYIGDELHALTRCEWPSSYYNDLWACPGMCQFLLTHKLGCRSNALYTRYLQTLILPARNVQAYVQAKLAVENLKESTSKQEASKHSMGKSQSAHSDPSSSLNNTLTDDRSEGLGQVHEFSYLLFYLLVRTSCVQKMTSCEPSTINVKLRKDCNAAIPATKRALEMWLGKENCGDCMGGGAGWVRFLVRHHLSEFSAELPLGKVAMQCIIEVCESDCRISLDLLRTLVEKPALRELCKLDVKGLRLAAQYMRDHSSENKSEVIAIANKLLRQLDGDQCPCRSPAQVGREPILQARPLNSAADQVLKIWCQRHFGSDWRPCDRLINLWLHSLLSPASTNWKSRSPSQQMVKLPDARQYALQSPRETRATWDFRFSRVQSVLVIPIAV
jgi:hypothetical protein